MVNSSDAPARAIALATAQQLVDAWYNDLPEHQILRAYRDDLVTRLTAALAEAKQRSTSEYSALQAKSVRDGIEREQRARGEEREACVKRAVAWQYSVSGLTLAEAIRRRQDGTDTA